MRFLIDQDVYATTIRFLEGLGHDVVPVAQLGLSLAEDEYLLSTTTALGSDARFRLGVASGRLLEYRPSSDVESCQNR